MTKREERELFLKIVFMCTFPEQFEETDALVKNFLIEEGHEELIPKMTTRVRSLLAYMEEIDDVINSHAQGWKTSRIAKVDLALLRIAIFEMTYEGLDKKIAINEVVELAKVYGEERSFAFINGILGKVGN